MTNLNIYCVYMHTSPSGKMYIGQTTNYDRRCKEHQKDSSQCVAFKNAIQKYGWDNFTHKIIEDNLDIDTANELEAFLIEECNTLSPNGYNLKISGANGRHSEETRTRMSKAQTGNTNSLGFKHTEEFCKKMSSINKGKVMSTNTRLKISISTTGDLNHFYGKNHSDEVKLKISVTHKGKNISETQRIEISKTALNKRLPYDELPNTIEEALERNLKIVKQTTPCKVGHLYGRVVKVKQRNFGGCLDCKKETSNRISKSKK